MVRPMVLIKVAANEGKLYWYIGEIIGPDGLATATFTWEGQADGRLFLQHIELFDYSRQWTRYGSRNNGDWDFKVELKIWETRPASIRFDEQVNGRDTDDFTTGKIDAPRVWREGIGFGEWESSLDTQGLSDFVSGFGDSR